MSQKEVSPCKACVANLNSPNNEILRKALNTDTDTIQGLMCNNLAGGSCSVTDPQY